MNQYIPEEFESEISIITKIAYADKKDNYSPIKELTLIEMVDNLKNTEIRTDHLDSAIKSREGDIKVQMAHLKMLLNKEKN